MKLKLNISTLITWLHGSIQVSVLAVRNHFFKSKAIIIFHTIVVNIPDSEVEEDVELVAVLHSEMERSWRTRYWPSISWSRRRFRNRCSRRSCSRADTVLRSFSSSVCSTMEQNMLSSCNADRHLVWRFSIYTSWHTILWVSYYGTFQMYTMFQTSFFLESNASYYYIINEMSE